MVPPSEPNGIPVLWPAEEEVTHVRKSDRPPLPPEALYKTAAPAARASIKAAVVEAYSGHVAALVRRVCPYPSQWRDAEQAGIVGLLLALEKFDPARGAHFWAFARQWVKGEVHGWLDRGVFWRVRESHGTRSDRAGRTHASLGELDPLHDVDDAEGMLATAEAQGRLRAFLATLTEREAHILLAEFAGTTGKREGASACTRNRARRHEALVARARAAVLGTDDEG